MRNSKNRSKTVIIIIAAVLLAGIGFTAGIAVKSSVASGGKDIGLDTAKEIALSSVGVSAEKATFTKSESDEDSYDIEFYTASNEYDFDINAKTGAIINREVSPRDLSVNDDSAEMMQSSGSADPAAQESNAAAQSEPAAPAQPYNQNDNDDSVIGVVSAKEIALNHAGLSEASFQEASLDYDDGVRVYDIEFIAGNKSYDYEINAYSGAIISYEIEPLEYDDYYDD